MSDLEKKLSELEKRIEELERRPVYYPQPVWVQPWGPVPYYVRPEPYTPPFWTTISETQGARTTG